MIPYREERAYFLVTVGAVAIFVTVEGALAGLLGPAGALVAAGAAGYG